MQVMKIQLLNELSAQSVRSYWQFNIYKNSLFLSGVKWAPFKLADVFRSESDKKMFEGSMLHCKFCNKFGHNIDFCPLKPTEPESSEKVDFVESLLNTKRAHVDEYKGLTLQQALDKLKMEGGRWNQGNAWEKSTEPSDDLRKHLGYWKAIGCNKSVLSWIAYGLPFRFFREPTNYMFPNHASTYEHLDFVRQEIHQHVEEGIFKEVDREFVKCVNPILVEEQNGKLRRCDDLRWVNAVQPKVPFKQQGLKADLPNVMKKDDFMFTRDIKKAYYKLAMEKKAWPYQCIALDGKFYAPKCLLFGGAYGPLYFTKICRQIVHFCRLLGIRLINLIDDWLWCCEEQTLTILTEFVDSLFTLLGWTFSDKSQQGRKVVFLGFLLDAETYKVYVPEGKVERVQKVLRTMMECASEHRPVTVRDIQILTGRVISMSLAIPEVRVWTRELYRSITGSQNQLVILGKKQQDELRRLAEIVRPDNGAFVMDTREVLDMYVDSSNSGFGILLNGSVTKGALSQDVIGQSSTHRELEGLKEAIKATSQHLQGRRVRVNMDSSCAIQNLVNGGGPVQQLCDTVKEITALLERYQVEPIFNWLPRENGFMKKVDEASKCFESQWTLKKEVVAQLRRRFAVTTVLMPQFGQISNLLKTIRFTNVKGIIVLPKWPAQSWWPLLSEASLDIVQLGRLSEVCEANPSRLFPPWEVVGALIS